MGNFSKYSEGSARDEQERMREIIGKEDRKVATILNCLYRNSVTVLET